MAVAHKAHYKADLEFNMANEFFDPSFRGSGSPGSLGAGSTQRGLQQVELNKQALGQGQFQAEQDREKARINSLFRAASDISSIPSDEGRMAFAIKRKQDLVEQGLPTQDTDEIIQLYQSGQGAQANELIDSTVKAGVQQGFLNRDADGLTSSQREFQGLTEGMSEADIKEARRIELGLSPRAGISAAERITEKGLTEDVAKSQATIKQAEEEAKLQAQLKLKPVVESEIEKAKGDVKASGKIIEQSFSKIDDISKNIRNLDRAIRLLDQGANTGAIEKFIPSFTAASRELRQVQNELGLDIIGSVTFGALSQGELDLALDTAIDLGQDPENLRNILAQKKDAQSKLINYLDDQIQFLEQGGTLAGWREKARSSVQQELSEPSADLSQLSNEQLAAEIARLQGGQ